MAETEAILLRRFTRTGDAEALAEIIRRHAGLVYGAALRILADVDRAADVAQETFLQLTKDAHNVTGSLPGWLHRVATHKAIDQMRRDASRRRREAAYVADRPREVTDWKDLSRHVDEALNELDAELRDILVAHFLQCRTTRQIAMEQGTSQATVSRRLDAGVTQLRATLRKRGLIVAAGALSLLLGENAIQAAPPALMVELGKMAIVGGHVAVGATAGATGGSFVNAISGGALAGVKAKVVAAAAVAVIGAGSVVTYRHATRPAAEHTVVARSPSRRTLQPAPGPISPSSPPSSISPVQTVSTAGPSEASRQWNELIAAGLRRSETAVDQVSVQAPASLPTPAAEQEALVPAAEVPPGGMGGFAAVEPQPAPPQQVPVEEPGPPAAMGGFYVARYPSPQNEPNDSNDRGPDEP